LTPLYDELVDWYDLVDPLEDHEDEAEIFIDILDREAPGARSLLELGSGAGNNAYYLKQRYDCTLTDLAPTMLERSRAINPACRHLEGDMRNMRLAEAFDIVFVHDAITHITTLPDLQAAIRTVAAHLKPGGAALAVPDYVTETFQTRSEGEERTDGRRTLRYTETDTPPAPGEHVYHATFVVDLYEDGRYLRQHAFTHSYGVFATAEWIEAFDAAGLAARPERRVLDDDWGEMVLFVARKPAA
jgi:SAM-dependent methyltransferase